LRVPVTLKLKCPKCGNAFTLTKDLLLGGFLEFQVNNVELLESVVDAERDKIKNMILQIFRRRDAIEPYMDVALSRSERSVYLTVRVLTRLEREDYKNLNSFISSLGGSRLTNDTSTWVISAESVEDLFLKLKRSLANFKKGARKQREAGEETFFERVLKRSLGRKSERVLKALDVKKEGKYIVVRFRERIDSSTFKDVVSLAERYGGEYKEGVIRIPLYSRS